MKQIVQWMARMFAMLLVLTVGAGVQPVNADLADGYYYFNSTAYEGQGLMSTTGQNRVTAAQHSYGLKVTNSDLPFVFHVTKNDDGTYYIQNYNNKMYWGRFADAADDSPGGGFGYLEDPEPFNVTESGIGYVFEYGRSDFYPGHGGCVHAQDDGYAGFWGDGSNIYAHKVWQLVAVDEESLLNPVDRTEITGSVADGYYYFNFSGMEDASTCMVPVNSEQLWRLGAYPRSEDDFDASYVWYVSKNADDTYSIQNCGAQDLTYIEVNTKGDKASPYIVMTSQQNAAKFKFKFMSDGTVYLYSTDNDYNFSVGSDGNICTVNSENTNSAFQLVSVPADKITNSLKLQMAISNAAGWQFTVGENPGQVSQADYDTFNAVYQEAVDKAGTEDDNSELIAKLNAATETLAGQRVAITDGYYTFENYAEGGAYLAPYLDGSTWYLSAETVDPTMDMSAVWHVKVDANGGYVLKNCGMQDSTYVVVGAGGYYWWKYVTMSGTQKVNTIFKNELSNQFSLYSSDSGNFYNYDWSHRISANNDWHPTSRKWFMVKVEAPFQTELAEAITDAAGVVKDSKIGPNPGDYNGDATELNAAIEAARLVYDSGEATETAILEEIAKLQAAVEAFNAQDHSMREIEEGYYYIKTSYDPFYGDGDKISLYVSDDNYLSWKALETKNASFLFKITPLGDGTFSMQNVQQATYVDANTSSGVNAVATQTTPQTFTSVGDGWWNISNTKDNVAYELKSYKSEPNGVISINTGSGIKTFTLVKQTDQALIDSLIAASVSTRLATQLTAVLQSAEPAYKATFAWAVDHNDGLITETDEDEPFEKGQLWGSEEPSAHGSYSYYHYLIDGDLGSCYQSTWNSGTEQFLQANLRTNPVSDFEFYFGLRDNDWGWKECWSDIDVYATNDAGIAAEDVVDTTKWYHVGNYTDMMSYMQPDGANMNSLGRYFYYRITGLDQRYQYIRFVINKTAVPQAADMFTIGEFQMYSVELDEDNSPYNYIPGLKAATDSLQAMIDAAKAAISANTVTQALIDDLTAQTARVVSLTPSTSALDKKISEVRDYISKFGYDGAWGDVSEEQYAEIEDAANVAEEYDHDQPIQSDLDERLATLETAFAAYKAAQLMPEANTWYFISNTDNSRTGYKGYDEGGTGDIWSRFSYGNVIMAPRTNTTQATYWGWSNYEGALKWDGYDRAANQLADSVWHDPYSMWRLVPMDNEGEYALQNRATGHYMTSIPRGNAGGMTITPTGYKLSLLKSGQFNITPADGSCPLHADGRKIVVTWDGTADSPSSWTFEPVDGNDISELEINVANLSAFVLTLPYPYNDENVASLNKENEVATYKVIGIEKSENGSYLKLTRSNTFTANEPMVVITGKGYREEADSLEEATTKMYLPLIDEFYYEAAEDGNGVHGTSDYTIAPEGSYIISTIGEQKLVDADSVALNGQSGYFDLAEVKDLEGEVDALIRIDGEIHPVGIEKVSNADGTYNVYTTDGVLIKKNVKANDAKAGLKKGVYIIGKEKVLVK